MRSLLKFVSVFVKSVAKYGIVDTEMRSDVLNIASEVTKQTFDIIKIYEDMSENSCAAEFLGNLDKTYWKINNN